MGSFVGKNHNRTDAEQDAWILADKRKRNKMGESEKTYGFRTNRGQVDLQGSNSAAVAAMKDGRKGFTANGGQNYVKNGDRWVSHTNSNDYYSLTPAEKEKEAPPPAAAPSSGGGGGGGGGSYQPSGGTASYGTTSPSGGNTGSQPLDATTAALMEMIASLTASIANSKKADASDVTKAAGSGLAETILTNSYIPSSEKKKKSYLTPIAVG